MKNWTAIDLFCGAGGLSEGFRQAGFRVLVGQDINSTFGKTFIKTHNEARFIHGPIQEISASEVLDAAGCERGEIDVIVGGPPCQGYSVYNHQRGENDPRARLFDEYLRMVSEIWPKWIVMENVVGITSIAGGAIVEEILTGIKRLGYRVEMRILKAEEYGIPQERRRIFFIATREESHPIHFPAATHGPSLKPFVTLWDAISDLPELKNGEALNELSYRQPPQNAYQAILRGDRKFICNHDAPRLSKINLQRMQHIPQGGSWRDIPIELLPNGMKKAKRSDHTKRYGRPAKTDLACTILTKCDLHWGAYIHPTQNRSFTVREAARLQSFPDSFVFYGTRTDQFVQVGNAVPPILGKVIGEAIQDAANLKDLYRETSLRKSHAL